MSSVTSVEVSAYPDMSAVELQAECYRLRTALQGFVDFQISDYDRSQTRAKRYCELRRAAVKLLSRSQPR